VLPIGAFASAANVISDNSCHGILIDQGQVGFSGNDKDQAINNIVQGNVIGSVSVGGSANFSGSSFFGPNSGCGVFIQGASRNQIGGTGPGCGNTIAYNGPVTPLGGQDESALGLKAHGVEVASGINNAIRQNSIFNNTGRAIDLGNDSFNINHLDPANGANNLQNYPVVTSVSFNGGTHSITWTLHGPPTNTYDIDFFSNDTPDKSGFGGGQTFLYSDRVTTDDQGKTTVNGYHYGTATWSETFPASANYISATATDPHGNTSEFSMVDTDGDGLADAWEVLGIDFDEDGQVDLTLPGADPNHKDIFVEVDAMAGMLDSKSAGLTFQPVVEAFALAPQAHVQNPDLKDGVTLHIQPDEMAIPLAPWTTKNNAGDATPYVDLRLLENGSLVNSDNFGTFGTPQERGDSNWPRIRGAKRLAYRYCLFAYTFDGGKAGDSYIPSPDFFVTLGWWGYKPFSVLDITDLASLVAKLKSPNGEVLAQDLAAGLSLETRTLLAGYPGVNEADLLDKLVKDLNGFIENGLAPSDVSGGLFSIKRFQIRQNLSADTLSLLGENPDSETDALKRLNRMLLEDSYPQMIRKVPQPGGGTYDQQAGTFMHELGHALGLRHGGGDGVNGKPNYHSVMNYTWQTPSSGDPKYTAGWRLDYSLGNLRPLDPNCLDERDPLGIGGQSTTDVPVGPVGPTKPLAKPQYVPEGGTVNWDASVEHGGVPLFGGLPFCIQRLNLNVSDSDYDPAPAGQTLADYDDWANLQYYVQEGPYSAFGSAQDNQPVQPELDLRLVERLSRAGSGLGIISLSSPQYFVVENQGFLVVTVRRVFEAPGTVTVDFATSDGTASAGVNYAATNGTLTFTGDQTVNSIIIPLLDDGFTKATETFQISLSNPAGGATLGFQSQATVNVQDANAATFVVGNTADDGPGSLRQAILDANAHPGLDFITFSIPGPGVHVILPTSPLPTITDPVVIDGYTQPGASPNTLSNADNAVLQVVLDCSVMGVGVPEAQTGGADYYGLDIAAGGCTIRGLVINNLFATWGSDPASGLIVTHPYDGGRLIGGASVGGGIRLRGGGTNVIEGNFIGVDPAGGSFVESHLGVEVTDGSSGNRIGGSTSAARNLIAAGGPGVYIWATNGPVPPPVANVVEGNYFDITATGVGPLTWPYVSGSMELQEVPGTGVLIFNSHSNIIGGQLPGSANVIANARTAIDLEACHDTIVQGNLLGTDSTGRTLITNAIFGSAVNQVFFDQYSDTRLGAAFSGFEGVSISTLFFAVGLGPNARNTVRGNLISGWQTGIVLSGEDNRVQGNLIGTDSTGMMAISNYDGIITFSGLRNLIGGTGIGEGNVISGNGRSGIMVVACAPPFCESSVAAPNLIQGNVIGARADGSGPLANYGDGFFIGSLGRFFPNGVWPPVSVGGIDPAAANLIAYNGGDGVRIATGFLSGPQPTGFSVLGNSIFGNGRLGIELGTGGVVPNDTLGHSGPNNFQNFPVLTSVATSAGTTTVQGTFHSQAGATFRLEFFANDAPNPSGYGEGQTFVGAASITTDINGDASFSVALPSAIGQSQVVTATATGPDGSTSEFSQALGIGEFLSVNINSPTVCSAI
jgi:hypothetical protein